MIYFPGIQLSIEFAKGCGPTLKEFKAKIAEDEECKQKIAALREQVENFAEKYPLPGFEDW